MRVVIVFSGGPGTLAQRLRALIEAHRMPQAGRLPLAPTPRARHDIGDGTRTSWAKARTRASRHAREIAAAAKRAWLESNALTEVRNGK